MENTQLIKSDIQKDNVGAAVAAITQSVENGDVSALEAITTLKWYESVVSAAKKEIMEQALTERSRFGKEDVTMFGYKISQMEAGTSYDYSQCGDEKWDACNWAIEDLKLKLKEREQFLKALKDPVTLVDEETGATNKVHPPVKRSTTTLKFS